MSTPQKPSIPPAASLGPVPALGHGAPLGGKERSRRLLVVALALVASVVGLTVRAQLEQHPLGAPPVTGASVVSDRLISGGRLSDSDLLLLRDLYDVSAIVDLRVADRTEGETASSFKLDYFALPLPERTAPSPADLRQLILFLKDSRPRAVYVHDDVGGGRARCVSAMLAMMESADRQLEVSAVLEEGPLSARQQRALSSLTAALAGPRRSNPYGAVARLRW